MLVAQNPPTNTGDIRDAGLIPGWGRSPGGEHGNPFQYSCLENPMDRGPEYSTGGSEQNQRKRNARMQSGFLRRLYK